MKTTVKAVSICIIVILLVSSLASCGPSMEDVAGTYSGSYTYNGNSFYAVIVLTEDGTYGKVVSKNGIPNSTDSGDFEIKGSKIRLYTSDDHKSYTEYTYSDGQIENGGHVFSK